jgi:hypothetical protein
VEVTKPFEMIDSLGGVDDGDFVPRRIDPDVDSPRQLSLFD